MIVGKSQIQGKGILRRLFVSVCVCVVPLLGMAQSEVLRGSGEGKVFEAEEFGFNAIDIRQGRFLYDDSVAYRRDKFYDHMTVGVVWHYDKIHERIAQGYGAALNYGLFVEKELTKTHALRLLLYEGSYQQLERSIRMNKYQVELLHSFNWTRYFGGYNPYRKVEAVTSLGLGAYHSERLDKIEVGGMFIASAGVRMQLSPLFVLGIEPYAALAGDGIDHSASRNYHRYDVLYGTDVSLSYTLHNELNKRQRQGYRGRTFVDFGIGVQFEPYTGFHLQPNVLPFMDTAGPHVSVGVGHWLSPGLAVRGSGNLSSSNWDNAHVEANRITAHPAYDIRLKNVLANGRLDLLFSPYHFFSNHEESLFDVNTIVGWEYGWMIKTSYDPADLLRTYYNGFSGGLQFRYNYDRHTALYVEPRITWANYTIPYAPPFQEYVDRYRDYLFTVTAGMEFSANENCLNGKGRQRTAGEGHLLPLEFAPNFSVALQGGPSYVFMTKEHAGDFYVDYTTGIVGEMQLSPYSGVRTVVDYSQLSNRDIYRYTQQMNAGERPVASDTALCISKYGFANVAVDYVFNLGTLLQGYDAGKRWDLSLAVGPVYSQRVRTKTVISEDEKLWEFRTDNPVASVPEVDHSRVRDRAWGLQVAIPVGYRINSNLSVLFEPRVRFFPGNYIDMERSGGFSKVLNTQVGLRYTLNNRQYVNRADSLRGHLFTHWAAGVYSLQAPPTVGPRIEAGIGYWFNPGIAVRGSFNVNSSEWEKEYSTLRPSPTSNPTPMSTGMRQVNTSGRLDALLNPYGYLRSRYDNAFGVNIVAGWECGMMRREYMEETVMDVYNALSGGLQLRYNNDAYRSFYVEPRYTYNLTTKDAQLSLVAGIELGATEHACRLRKMQPDEFVPTQSFTLSGGTGHLFSSRVYSDSPLLPAYTFGLAAEHRFTPYSGVRVTAGYTNYMFRGLYNYYYMDYGTADILHDYRMGYMSVGVDYLLDLCTLLQGYTADRRWNASLAVGPFYGLQVTRFEPAFEVGYKPSYSAMVSKHLFGVQVGVPLSFRIIKNWDAQLEPRVKSPLNSSLCSWSTGRYPLMQFDMLLGVKYTF